MSSFKHQNSGFTLLEVLLALAIMAMLSLSGYLILDGVLRVESQQRHQLDALRQIQRSVVVMDQDFQQMIPRSSRDSRLQYPMFSLSPNWLQSDSGRVSFIRGGWHNPQSYFKRSNLQLVAYRVKKNVLERIYWPHIDINRENASGFTIPLFNDVKSFKVEVFSQGRWKGTRGDNKVLPKAIRLTIQFNKQHKLQRLYLMP